MAEAGNEKYSRVVEIKHYCKKIEYPLFNSSIISEILSKVLDANLQIVSTGNSNLKEICRS